VFICCMYAVVKQRDEVVDREKNCSVPS